MVVTVRETLKKHKHDEQQRDDKVNSVHESKRKGSIAESNFPSRLLLRQQAGEALRLKHDKDDTNDERLQHPSSKQALPFAPNVKAGRLQGQASQDQQHRADRKRRWEPKATFRWHN